MLQNSEEFYKKCSIKRKITIPFFRKEAFFYHITEAFGSYNAKWIKEQFEHSWKKHQEGLEGRGLLYLALEGNLRFTIDRHDTNINPNARWNDDPTGYRYDMTVYCITNEAILNLEDGEAIEIEDFRMLSDVMHWGFASVNVNL